MKMKIAALCCIVFLIGTFIFILPVNAESEFVLNCASAILIEAETGKVLFEQNADQPLPPASVTKIMTLLLVMDAIENKKISIDDILVCSDNAASMGGSQIYLEAGEQMSVEDLIKSVVISSANDAALVLAEAVAGSEDAFVAKMNQYAAELGMKNTTFENTNGLDDTVTKHLTSARDIAIMSRELIKYETILKYSSIWMDSVRNGTFGLTNTNRLIRFYKGATGLKTGSTSKAMFCISATAKRDNMHLICVIMGAETRDIRNASATQLLDWGFANYSLYMDNNDELGSLKVKNGKMNTVDLVSNPFYCVISKGNNKKIEKKYIINENISAPIKKGDILGTVEYICSGTKIGSNDIVSADSIEKIEFMDVLERLFSCFLV